MISAWTINCTCKLMPKWAYHDRRLGNKLYISCKSKEYHDYIQRCLEKDSPILKCQWQKKPYTISSEIKLTTWFLATYSECFHATYFLELLQQMTVFIWYKFYKIGITPTWSQHSSHKEKYRKANSTKQTMSINSKFLY